MPEIFRSLPLPEPEEDPDRDVRELSQRLLDAEIKKKFPDIWKQMQNLRLGYQQGNLTEVDENLIERTAHQLIELKTTGELRTDEERERIARRQLRKPLL